MKFEPLTFGYEWEALLLKPNLMPLDKREIEWMANRIREKLPWSRTGLDDMPGFDAWLLEIRSGIMSSYDEMKERTHLQVQLIKKMAKFKDWTFFPCGSHPAFGNAIGLHVHIGTINKFESATCLANSLARYAPCFAALSSNSPVWGLESREYKSYRVLKFADWCSVARVITDPEIAQFHWGDDVSVKIGMHPTIEFRIGDSSSSEQFVNEYVAFVVAFVSTFIKKEISFNKEQYIESILNRWRAAKYGLQAIFLWNGKEVPVTDILNDMLSKSDLKAIKCPGLNLIPKMLCLRQTQADFQLLIHSYNKDPHQFAKALSNLLSKKDQFKIYLKMAKKLPILEPISIDDYLLSKITIETPYEYLHTLTGLPYPILEQNLNKLEKSGKIKSEKIPEEGLVYTRI
ncbi:hypothetical protein KAW65_06220 [candidate division WOR-3 bacterium]|nr:hypothetical protein [candidate division WOR-3 bacterium]